MPRLPCAALLVRLVKTSGIETGPSVAAPPYSSGQYWGGGGCEPREVDHVCFRARLSTTAAATAAAGAAGAGAGGGGAWAAVPPASQTVDESVALLCSSLQQHSSKAAMPPASDMKVSADASLFAPLGAEACVLSCVDLLFNLPEPSGGLFFSPKPRLFKVVTTMVAGGGGPQAGGRFLNQAASASTAAATATASATATAAAASTAFTRSSDASAHVCAPRFLDDFASFAPPAAALAVGGSAFLVVEVLTIQVQPALSSSSSSKKQQAVILSTPPNEPQPQCVVDESPQACFWALLPLNRERVRGAGATAAGLTYVVGGAFQLPLICGPVPSDPAFWADPELALRTGLAWGHSGRKPSAGPYATMAGNPLVRPLKLNGTGASVVVRVGSSTTLDCMMDRAAGLAPSRINQAVLQSLVEVAAEASQGLSIPRTDMFAIDFTRYPSGPQAQGRALGATLVKAALGVGEDPEKVTAAVDAAANAVLEARLKPKPVPVPVSAPAAPAVAVGGAAQAKTQPQPQPQSQPQGAVTAPAAAAASAPAAAAAPAAATKAPTGASVPATPTPASAPPAQVGRPALDQALGHTVEVPMRLLDPSAGPHDYCPPGRVVKVDADKRTITVSFEVEPGEPEDLETLSFDLEGIEWVK